LYDIIDEARVTQDQAKRRELYVQAQGILLEDAFYGFLFFRPIAFPMSVRVQDFPMDVDGGWRLGELWVAE
jgi:ABC-type transport system substrate-binding protein